MSNTLVLVFDVETSGLIPKGEPVLDVCPYILQLSFVVFDTATMKIIQQYNSYINVPSKVRITPEIERLTGITRAKCNSGVVVSEALDALYTAYIKCSRVIAHNIEFDSKMVRIELARNSGRKTRHLCDLLNTGFEIVEKKERYCTMANSIELCNIMVDAIDKRGQPYQYKKFPKLSELHVKLFGTIPENLHDSMVDTLACLRCYMKLAHNVEIQI
uniref:Exonuclease domain-containing protein n=1 Tax=viral metagenome TaxID=1070528 RepID=A0A6C0HIE1_9ZZZZ